MDIAVFTVGWVDFVYLCIGRKINKKDLHEAFCGGSNKYLDIFTLPQDKWGWFLLLLLLFLQLHPGWTASAQTASYLLIRNFHHKGHVETFSSSLEEEIHPQSWPFSCSSANLWNPFSYLQNLIFTIKWYLFYLVLYQILFKFVSFIWDLII